MMASWGCGPCARGDQREDGGADEGEAEAHPVHAGTVRIAARERHEHRDRRAERRDLRQRQIDEDDAALDDVQAEVGVDAGEDEACGEWRGQELQNGRIHR